MKTISTLVQITETYTNHCFRAMTMMVLKRAGVQPTDIIAVTGHRNIGSLASDASKPTNAGRANMSDILAKYGKICQ